jgi:methylenetetrahydrofolate reductase (NADPH)
MAATMTETVNRAAPAFVTFAGELVGAASLEISIESRSEVPAIATLLPVGTRVYVNHSPRHTLVDALPALEALHKAGLDPVPHIAARRVLSRAEVRGFLERATAECGVSKVLLVGGDDPEPRGPYDSGAALLRDRVFHDSDVREIGVPGYPEGHPRIPATALRQALKDKLALAIDQGLGFHVVSQFSFSPARVVEYCAFLARELPGVPVYVGMAGPTDPLRLLRFAQRCGVSSSLRALKDQGFATVKLVTHTDPGEQLAAVAHHCASQTSCNVVGIHLFTFGSALKSAQWMSEVIARSGI